MNKKSLLLVCLSLWVFSACGADQTLSANTAKLTGPNIRMQGQQAAYWKAGESVEWRVHSDRKAAQNLTVDYAAPEAVTLTIWLDDKKVAEKELPSTKSWDNYRRGILGGFVFTKGDHTLRLTALKGGEYCLNVRSITFASDAKGGVIRNLVAESAATKKSSNSKSAEAGSASQLPELYSQGKDWASTMVAMRQKMKDPKIQTLLSQSGKKSARSFNAADGNKLWRHFPKENDWFIQDNQVHGAWGSGLKYNARSDYTAYLKSDRDSTLEQKLIGNVLKELGTSAASFATRLNALIKKDASPDDAAWLELYVDTCLARRQVRLAPLLEKTDKIIYATHQNMGIIYLETETQGCPDGSQLRLIDLSPEKEGRPLTDELLFDSKNGIVRDPELSFDGKKLLFAWRKTNRALKTVGQLAPAKGNYKIYEMDLATRAIRPLTNDDTYGADFEPCYLPNGDIMFSSVRCVQEVTCGWGDASNLYVMDKDGKYARRIGFDQTQTGFPHLLNDGRVVYTRRDYNDRGQTYAHSLFVMNTDGTSQTEFYGNNTSEPTSLQHARPIPGSSSKCLAIAGGYHTTQGGKLVVVDTTKGRQEYQGIEFLDWDYTQKRTGGDMYGREGHQSTYPYPIDKDSFLVSHDPFGYYLLADSGVGIVYRIKEGSKMRYKLYYMTMDGKREMLAADPVLSCTQGLALTERTKPQVRATAVNYTKDSGTMYVQNVYYGPGAEGIKPGSVKKIRVTEIYYKPVTIGAGGWSPPRDQVGPGKKYSGVGWHSVLPVGVGSASFDAKGILGEADVHEDGSAMFEVPARTPIYLQLIDEKGDVLQSMRSWATLMPNENFSCVGCHEDKNSTPLLMGKQTQAMQRAPQKLKPFYEVSGKPFSYAKMVQPIFNKHCVSCHAPGKKAAKIDLSDTVVSDYPEETWCNSTRRKFYQSYLTLLDVKWTTSKVKDGGRRLDEGRPNKWVDYYTRLLTVELLPPYYAGATKSGLLELLRAGHKNVKISEEELNIISAWIDLNVPFIGEYDEMNIWDDKAKRIYGAKMEMRRKMEAIEAENIQAFIDAGQP